MTDLSIIIVCHKGWSRLRRCLDSLDIFTGRSLASEVIVVDNRSDDGEISKIEEEYPRFRFLRNSINGGFANGCNLGARNASGRYFLFLNPDTVVSEDELERLVITAAQNPEFTIVSCKQLNENGRESMAYGEFPSYTNLTGFQRAILKILKRQAGDRQTDIVFPDWVSGSVILLRKETFLKAGGFDEDFWMYFEDVDLCKRIRVAGGEIAFCRDISVEHNHGGSSRASLETTSITKSEVRISQHVYVSKNMKGFGKYFLQAFIVFNNIISGFILGVLGLPLFFIPGIFSRTLIFFKLMKYYSISLTRLSWISPRSANFNKV